MIQVIACPHPLRADRVLFELPLGATVEDAIAEAAERASVQLRGMSNAVVVIGDRIVPKDQWRHVRPKDGAQVTLKAIPAGPAIPLIASVAGFAATSLIPTAFALAYPIATTFAIAGITWISPLHTSMAP